MVLTERRYTADEWLDLPDDGHRYELVEGKLVVLPPRTLDEDRVRKGVQRLVERAEEIGYGEFYGLGVGVILDPDGARSNVRTPALFFLRKERLYLAEGRALEGIPDLAVEILGPEGRGDELPGGRKFADYERFGLPEYWVADPATRTIAQYTLREGYYGLPVLLLGREPWRSPLLPGISPAVDEAFAGVKQPARPLIGPGPFRLAENERPRT